MLNVSTTAACLLQSSAAALMCEVTTSISLLLPCGLTGTYSLGATRSQLWESTNIDCVQDYFSASVGPVKKVILNYGPTGRSRGSATVVFSKPTGGAEAVKLDGTIVDGKKMRVCLPSSFSACAQR